MFNLGTESLLDVYYSFNFNIDFCLWLLEIDGLRVHPFDLHPEGQGMLRSRGLNAEDWRDWFNLVVLLQDRRLNWRVDELSVSVETALASSIGLDPKNKREPERSQLQFLLEKYFSWQDLQFQQAETQVGQFFVDSRFEPPPAFWLGDPEIGNMLRYLWQRYKRLAAKRDSKHRRQTEQAEIRHRCRTSLLQYLQRYEGGLSTLEIYQVGYPYPVECAIAPASLVISMAAGLPHSDSFYRSVWQAIDSLQLIDREEENEDEIIS